MDTFLLAANQDAAQPYDEAVTNKPHSKRDFEQATHSSYYEVITENAFTGDDTDTTFQYDFITQENADLVRKKKTNISVYKVSCAHLFVNFFRKQSTLFCNTVSRTAVKRYS